MEEKEGVVVTTLDGLMDHLLPLVFLKQQAVTVENGQIMDLDEWKERLTALGYERTAQVDGMGQFSIRGGIVDIFPLTEEVPVRIELWMMRWTPSAVSTRKASGLWNSWKKLPFILQPRPF